MSRGSLQARAVSPLRDDGPAVMSQSALRVAPEPACPRDARAPEGTRPPAQAQEGHRRADGEGARARAGWLRGQDPLRSAAQHRTIG